MHVPIFLGLVVSLAISHTTSQNSSDSSCTCTFEPGQVSGKTLMWVDAKRLPNRYFIIPEIRYLPWNTHYGLYNLQLDWNRQRALLTPGSSIMDSYPEYLHDMENGTMYEKHPNGTCIFYTVPKEANILRCLPNKLTQVKRTPKYRDLKQLDENLYYRDLSRIFFRMKVGFNCTPSAFLSIRLLPNKNGLQIYQAISIQAYSIPNVEKTLYPNYQNCKKTTWRLP